GQAQAVAHVDVAGREGVGLHVEGAGAVGHRGAVGADHRSAADVHACPRCVRGAAVERGDAGEVRIVLEQQPQVVAFGELLFGGPQRRAVGVVGEQRDVAAVVAVPGEHRDLGGVHGGGFGATVTGLDPDAVE